MHLSKVLNVILKHSLKSHFFLCWVQREIRIKVWHFILWKHPIVLTNFSTIPLGLEILEVTGVYSYIAVRTSTFHYKNFKLMLPKTCPLLKVFIFNKMDSICMNTLPTVVLQGNKYCKGKCPTSLKKCTLIQEMQ